jgi:hypothetical protein
VDHPSLSKQPLTNRSVIVELEAIIGVQVNIVKDKDRANRNSLTKEVNFPESRPESMRAIEKDQSILIDDLLLPIIIDGNPILKPDEKFLVFQWQEKK